MSTTVGLTAFLAGLTIFFTLYAIFAPKKDIKTIRSHEEVLSSGQEMTDAATAFDRYVRPMLRNFLPQSPLSATLNNAQHDKISELLIRSGNPWNLRPEEYRGTQILFAFFGAIAGLALWVFNVVPIPGFLFAIFLPIMGWALVFSVHNSARENRVKEVTKQLPEALDLLVVTMTSGQNFEPALSQITPRLPEGLLREEFSRVNADIASGRGLEASLNSFARRAASDEVESFAKSVVQTQKLGADVTETLVQQAAAARQAYEAKLEKKIAKLSSNMFMFLIPTMLPAFMIIFIAPVTQQLSGTLF